MKMSNARRFVLLGKTGAGKSSLANTIFGEEVFTIDHSANSETKQCQAKTRSVNGRIITLIDTPGFFDTDISEEDLKSEIARCIIESAPGPHAFLIVLKVEKYTEHEQDVIKKIHEYFSEEVFKYATVVFTHGDQLPRGQKIKDHFRRNALLSDLVKKCGGRCHVIDNKYWNENPQDEYRSNRFQVGELLTTIENMVMANNRSYYTNEMLLAVEEEIQLEGERIRLLQGDMTEEEIREQAKGRVFKKFRIKLAGVGTGVLLGALCGLVVPLGVVVIVLKGIGKTLVDGAKIAAAAAVKELGAKAAAGGAVAAATGAAAAGGAAAVAGGAVAGVGVTAAGAAEGAAAAGAAAAAAGGTAAAAAAEGAAAAGAAAAGGTAAVTGAAEGAAVVGGAAAGATAAITLSAVAGACAAVGAAIGGVRGYNAAEGAETAGEAAKRAAETVKDDVKSIFQKINAFFERQPQPRYEQT